MKQHWIIHWHSHQRMSNGTASDAQTFLRAKIKKKSGAVRFL